MLVASLRSFGIVGKGQSVKARSRTCQLSLNFADMETPLELRGSALSRLHMPEGSLYSLYAVIEEWKLSARAVFSDDRIWG